MADQKPMSKARKNLLGMLVYLTSDVYNGFICNWGPNGIPYASGRSFLYPCRFRPKPGEEKLAKKAFVSPAETPDELLMTGHFKFGANEMPVYINMNIVLEYLEKNYGLVIPEDE